MVDILKDLNKEQKEAVTHDKGPLLVIAGAGTGKTGVITRRIAHIIKKKKAHPEEILSLTFTDKAALEMEERVDKLVPYGFVDTWISTFHAFGDRVLRENALELGLPSDFRILSRPEQVVFVRERLFEFDLKHYMPLGNPFRHIEALLNVFSRLKDEDISSKSYLEWAKKQKDGEEKGKHEEVAKAYEKYQKLMKKEGFLDFGDQIVLTLDLFRDKKSVLKKYQDQFKYILVDEFQDTNYTQNELLKLLAGSSGNITVVGDDDQSIYRFRGAAISNILDFKKDYPKARQIVLTKNYRSSQAILDSAYKLIKHNDPDRLEVKNNIVKKLDAESGVKSIIPEHLHFDTISSESDKVADMIKERVAGGSSYKDIAILVRGNAQADPFMQALSAKGIPYKFAGSTGLYSRPEVRLILSFIRAITDTSDNLSLYHLLTSEVYKVPVSDAVVLTTEAKKGNKILGEALKSDNLDISEDSLGKIEIILDDLENYRDKSKTDTAGQVIYSFLSETGYLKNLVSEIDKNVDADVKIQNIAKFFDKVTEFEYVSIDKGLMKLKEEIDDLIKAGDDPATAEVDPDLDAVNILTVHKSKGLEFKTVFMVGLVNQRFPSRKMSDPLIIPEELVKEKLPEGDFHLQEERRLFYVGMTRAKEELLLTSAEDYGGKRPWKVSQFVLEALDKPKVDATKYKLDKIEQIKKHAKVNTKDLIKKFYSKDKVLQLSPRKIDDYLSCPLKFKYIHILEIPLLKHHPIIYGNAIHLAVQEYFVRKVEGYPVTLEDIISVYEKTWISEGWISIEHEEKRFEVGKQTLRRFFEKEEKSGRLPTLVESKFGFVLNIDGVRTKVSGRYDAVFEESSDASVGATSKLVEIRDFKTSDVKDQKTANQKAKSNRQLAIYALSYRESTGKIPDEVTLHFIDKDIIGTVKKTEKDLDKTVEEIEMVTKGIVADDFKANPAFGECQRCAYREICPKTEVE